jgi:hypothetical protein
MCDPLSSTVWNLVAADHEKREPVQAGVVFSQGCTSDKRERASTDDVDVVGVTP